MLSLSDISILPNYHIIKVKIFFITHSGSEITISFTPSQNFLSGILFNSFVVS